MRYFDRLRREFFINTEREESNHDTGNFVINFSLCWPEGSHRMDSKSGQVARSHWRQEISDDMADDLPF